MLRSRRRTGRHDGRLSAGAHGNRHSRIGKTRGFPSRFPGRHHTRFDAGDRVRIGDSVDFVKEQASRYETFHLKMQAEGSDLVIENGTVKGVQAKTPEGVLEVR